MPDVNVKIDWMGEQVTAAMRQAVMRGVVAGTETVRNEAIRSVQQGPKTGRLYRRRGVVHQASAPGEPPATDTGRLVNSITTSYDADKLAGTVSANTEYAEFLEFGTQKMEPRPFMRPALAEKGDEIASLIAKAVSAVFPK